MWPWRSQISEPTPIVRSSITGGSAYSFATSGGSSARAWARAGTALAITANRANRTANDAFREVTGGESARYALRRQVDVRASVVHEADDDHPEARPRRGRERQDGLEDRARAGRARVRDGAGDPPGRLQPRAGGEAARRGRRARRGGSGGR